MIDFRYHLVSLIAVFMALAVGVVLGAGPLQGTLGSALSDQVTQLRADRNRLSRNLETPQNAVNDRDSYISASSKTLLAGSLSGQRVAVVSLPGANSDDVDATVSALTNAGATISARVSLTDAWVSKSRETFRSTYAAQFASYLPGTVKAASGNELLGQGLAVALTSPESQGSNLQDLLTASENPLIKVESKDGVAGRIVVVGPRSVDPKSVNSTEASAQNTNWLTALRGVSSVAPTVLEGAASSDTDLVSAARSAGTTLTTVDSVGSAPAAVTSALALANAKAATKAAYGFAANADGLMPGVAK